MLSTKIQTALNAQINAEFWSGFLYLSMSTDFASKGMTGFASWMEVQFKEEQDHAMKFINYIISRGGKVEIKPIEAVKATWNSPLDAFKDTLAHEQKVTAMINNLYSIAIQENDYASQSMLQWFINEQVEEEQNAQALIDALSMIKDNGFGLYTLDKELATRVYVPIPVQ